MGQHTFNGYPIYSVTFVQFTRTASEPTNFLATGERLGEPSISFLIEKNGTLFSSSVTRVQF